MAQLPDEQTFMLAVERVFEWIEAALDELELDLDSSRKGPVLEIEFADGSRVILNAQTPLRELWLASRAGGRHFRQDDGVWCDTRTGQRFEELLCAALSLHAGAAVTLPSPPA
jgi:CyaY protein